MKKSLNQVLDDWKLYRKMTLDLLQTIPTNKLNFTVDKSMGVLGKQFRHIGDVQLCYIEAVKTKKIDFSKYRRDYSIENSKTKLEGFLKEMDTTMFSLITKLAEQGTYPKIDWGFRKVDLVDHLRYLIHHEVLHHGELIVYIRTLGLKFPKSWSAWGL